MLLEIPKNMFFWIFCDPPSPPQKNPPPKKKKPPKYRTQKKTILDKYACVFVKKKKR